MNILGISALDKESTASLVVEGKLVAAVSEERISRLKQQDGFPQESILEVCRIAGIEPSDIEAVAYPFMEGPREFAMRTTCQKTHLERNRTEGGSLWARLNHAFRYRRITRLEEKKGFMARYDSALTGGLQELSLANRLHRYDHQHCHAASVVYTSPVDSCLVVTMDNYGSGASASAHRFDGERIEHLTTVPYPNSMGIFYALVTKNLGFRPDRHEGKILGLAAYGNTDVLYERVRARFLTEPRNFFYRSVFHQSPDRKWARDHAREDVAAAYQRVLEEVVVGFVRDHLEWTGLRTVCLAGGTFANVKLNQRIAELDGVDQVYIHPGMTDMGTGTGAALAHAEQIGEASPYKMEHALLGPEYSEEEIRAEIDRVGLEAEHLPRIEERIAELLDEGAVIGRFDGRMEYGPRALGSRSILSRATDPDINDTLNDRLQRTEFMPFAPATIAEEADRCYLGLKKARHAAEFMTITFDCTDFMKEKSPAAVHVDGTARPQVVRKEINPSYHEIIRAYFERTGIPSIINTSFNIHEEPIIRTPHDAIKTFQDGRLDYLAVGKFLIRCK